MSNINPRVVTIILNWNGWQDTLECLESIFRMDYSNFKAVVVDNGSTDGSLEKIKEWAEGKIVVESKYFKFNPGNKPISDDRLVLVSLKENVGFARGNNVGIRYVLSNLESEYILILNNDTIVRPDFLTPLVEVLQKYPMAALVSPKIIDYYSGIFWQKPIPKRLNLLTYIIFATQLYRFFVKPPIYNLYFGKESKNKKVYIVPGCCMFFKREALEKIGLFDESTFLGWEEYIVGEKLFQHNLDTYFVPESIIYHKVGKGTGQIKSLEKIIIFLKSERYFQEKFLKMTNFKRLTIKVVRLLIYTLSAIWDKTYRQNLFRLAKIIFSN